MSAQRNKLLNLLVIVVLSLTLTLIPYVVSSAPVAETKKPTELRAISGWPLSLKFTYFYSEYIKEVNSRAQKEGIPITIKGLGGPEVVAPLQQLHAIRSGTVDMAFNSGDYFVGECVEGSVMASIKPDTLYFYSTLRETKIMDVINDAYRKKSGVIALFPCLPGQRFTLLSTKSFKPDNWSGLKVRTYGGATTVGVTGMGGSPMTIPPAEVFEALQRGTVDAIIGCAADRMDWGERGVYRYFLTPGIIYAVTYWFISAKVWDGLPDNAKALMKAVGNDLEKFGYSMTSKWDFDATTRYMEEEKVKLIWASPEEQRKIAKAFRAEFLDFVVKKSPDFGPKIYELLKNHVY